MYVRIVQTHVVWVNALNVKQILFVMSVKLVINFKLLQIYIMYALINAIRIKYINKIPTHVSPALQVVQPALERIKISAHLVNPIYITTNKHVSVLAHMEAS